LSGAEKSSEVFTSCLRPFLAADFNADDGEEEEEEEEDDEEEEEVARIPPHEEEDTGMDWFDTKEAKFRSCRLERRLISAQKA
jgi:hypothetical protein